MNLMDLTPEQREEILKRMEKTDSPMSESDISPYVDPIALAGGAAAAGYAGNGLVKAAKQIPGVIVDKAKRDALREIAESASKKAAEKLPSVARMADSSAKKSPNFLEPAREPLDIFASSPRALPARVEALEPVASDVLDSLKFSRLRKQLGQ